MMHPDTELRLINDVMGYGVFATRPIAAGTVVYVKDALDLLFPPDHVLINDPLYRDTVEKYTYIEPDGTRVLSWDHAKYVNHCCDPSTLTTGYGFEIALRDLMPGDEITDDYAIFNSALPMDLVCHKAGCRGRVIPGDFDRHVRSWDARIRPVLRRFHAVEQPLARLIAPDIREMLERFLRTGRGYRSVATQKLPNFPSPSPRTVPVTLNGQHNSAVMAAVG